MNKLHVSEIFAGIQGEGFHTGRPAKFVRFAGCNLNCKFCDTKYAWEKGISMTYEPRELVDILSAGKKLGFIVLTGGEPMIQDQEALEEFVRILKCKGYRVAMETNGTKAIDRIRLPLYWVTISPKTAIFHTKGDELKLLYDGTQDLKFYERFEFEYFYLQPILPVEGFSSNNQFVFKEAFKKVEKAVLERPIWRVSFQAHKLVGYK